jgi:hypothetical protein
MGTPRAAVVHKHFRLDAAKLKRAQKLLNAPTETETVERALDLAIAEEERDRRVRKRTRSFSAVASRFGMSSARSARVLYCSASSG